MYEVVIAHKGFGRGNEIIESACHCSRVRFKITVLLAPDNKEINR